MQFQTRFDWLEEFPGKLTDNKKDLRSRQERVHPSIFVRTPFVIGTVVCQAGHILYVLDLTPFMIRGNRMRTSTPKSVHKLQSIVVMRH